MNWNSLKKKNPKIYRIYEKEEARQARVINLIPSENYVSPAVLEALGTEFVNKYAEGYPKKRYYFGNKYIDEIEEYTQELALKLFKLSSKKWSVNAQPYSGSPANLAIYLGLLKPGDKILAMSLGHGGHLTHGHKVSATGQLFKFRHYGVNREGFIDYDRVLKIARQFKPKLIVAGITAYPRKIDFKKFGQIADKVGAYLMADIAHIAGLIVAGAHPSPFPYADVVTSTTHKTLRGPRGAFIISKRELAEKIDKIVFPGLQGGPHMNKIAAMAVAFEEALKPSFKAYSKQVVKNARVLAEDFNKYGFKLISGGTDNHLILIDVTPLKLSGKQAGELLEKAEIVVNKNTIPYEKRKPWDPSGIRIGTPAVTTRGMKEREMKKIAEFIKRVLVDRESSTKVAKEVVKLTDKFKAR
jgi:glycine hydroxymethyltransferase